MPNSSTPAQYVLILIDMMEGRGCPSDELLAGTTLAQAGVSGIGARIRNTDFNRLVSNAQNLTGDPVLGLQLGLRLNLSAHAVLGQAFMTCTEENWPRELSHSLQRWRVANGKLARETSSPPPTR